MIGPAAASTATATPDTAPARLYEPRRELIMAMAATPNIAPPSRARAPPAMNRVAPGTCSSGR